MHLPQLAKPLSNLHTAQFYGLLLKTKPVEMRPSFGFLCSQKQSFFFFFSGIPTKTDTQSMNKKAQPHCRCKTGCCQTERSKDEMRWIKKGLLLAKNFSIFHSFLSHKSPVSPRQMNMDGKNPLQSLNMKMEKQKKKIQSMYSYSLEESGLNQTAKTHLEPK